MAAPLVHTLTTPVDLLALHAGRSQRYPFLLETVSSATGQVPYDLLFVSNQQHLTLTQGMLNSNVMTPQNNDFLQQLDAWWAMERTLGPRQTRLPFHGGWFVFLGYELAAQIEPSLHLPASCDGLPQAMAVRCPAAIIHDRHRQCSYIVCEEQYHDIIPDVLADIESLAELPPAQPCPAIDLQEDDPQRYLDGVMAIKEYIREGDIFQANLSRAWRGEFEQPASPVQIYRQLRKQNPGPFSGLCALTDGAIISSSPERLLRVHSDGVIETRPIAGTRPRSHQPAQDQALSQRLLSHPKERAEHIMLIDLERNDLGRVCVPGSVQVNELLTVESYAYVHHIVSNIQGQLRAGTGPGQVLRAVFPGGTITGCPKVRCMEIIAELEQTARGPYTGSMGYLNRDGSMDLNILIRTIVQQGRHIEFRAGAGIVADSRADRELDETRAKARGLCHALQSCQEPETAC